MRIIEFMVGISPVDIQFDGILRIFGMDHTVIENHSPKPRDLPCFSHAMAMR